MMTLDHDACYQAILSRDSRFDGRLFTGVHTTGIYCRPICPARTPKSENVTFFPTAAAAQEAGFRPCLRCRPESSPDLAVWRGSSNTVRRALGLISEGALDGQSVDAFAERLGVGERHLRRLFKQHLGASPIAVAQTRRVLFAKQLIQETRMPMAEVALAAGFGSVRRFNAVFQELYHRPPRALRRTRKGAENDVSGQTGIVLDLAYAAPYDWETTIRFLADRMDGESERIDEAGHYHRMLEIDGATGTVRVAPSETRQALSAEIRHPKIDQLAHVVNRLRRRFDLTADPDAIGSHLAKDPALAHCVAARPGLRVPGPWADPDGADPDAFSPETARLQSLLERLEGYRSTTASLTERAETWRPWRAYAVHHLWASEWDNPAGASRTPETKNAPEIRA